MAVWVYPDGWSAKRRAGALFEVLTEEDFERLLQICPEARDVQARIRGLAGLPAQSRGRGMPRCEVVEVGGVRAYRAGEG